MKILLPPVSIVPQPMVSASMESKVSSTFGSLANLKSKPVSGVSKKIIAISFAYNFRSNGEKIITQNVISI